MLKKTINNKFFIISIFVSIFVSFFLLQFFLSNISITISFPPRINKKALLVGGEFEHKQGINLMESLLKKRGYDCYSFISSYKEEILDNLKETATDANELIFFYSGHGNYKENKTYLYLGGDEKDSVNTKILASELFDLLSEFKCKKVIILDACHSGGFVDYAKSAKINNCVVIASCPVKNISMTSTNFIKGKRIGQLTFGLYNILKYKRRVNLSKVNILCAKESFRKDPSKVEASFKRKVKSKLSFKMQRYSDIDFYL